MSDFNLSQYGDCMVSFLMNQAINMSVCICSNVDIQLFEFPTSTSFLHATFSHLPCFMLQAKRDSVVRVWLKECGPKSAPANRPQTVLLVGFGRKTFQDSCVNSKNI